MVGDKFGLGPVAWRHPGDDLGQHVGELACGLDPRVEGDGAAKPVVANRLGEGDVLGERLGVCLDVLVGFDDEAFVDHLPVPRVVESAISIRRVWLRSDRKFRDSSCFGSTGLATEILLAVDLLDLPILIPCR